MNLFFVRRQFGTILFLAAMIFIILFSPPTQSQHQFKEVLEDPIVPYPYQDSADISSCSLKTSLIAMNSIPEESSSIGNPETRDKWMKRVAESTIPGSLILDVSAGNRPYRSLWSHCIYKSHEFDGNAKILDDYRGEKDASGKRLHDFFGDVTSTGAPSDSFDVVLLTEVLEHVPQPFLAIKELVRVAKPGGNIYITSPFTSGSHQQPYHFSSGYSQEFYHYAAKELDLEVISIESQGDYFKLMAQEISRALTCARIDPSLDSDVEELKSMLQTYFLKLSHRHGDDSKNKAECANMFTIGFMVHMRKK
jgi:ubiquinone/menaquinone biosynthesis C-methylase UbiE